MKNYYLYLILLYSQLGCGINQEKWEMSNSSSPQVLLFEVCPNPEMKEETEARELYRYFNAREITYSIITNDIRWGIQTELSEKLIQEISTKANPEIIHFAIHGIDSGLVISSLRNVEQHFFSKSEMEKMDIWRDKIIVSGACEGGKYAEIFIKQGAEMVIASEEKIPWENLGKFFTCFYEQFFIGKDPNLALSKAKEKYPEYSSYKLYQK